MLAFDLIRALRKYISLDEQALLETLLEAASPPMRGAPRPCITFWPLAPRFATTRFATTRYATTRFATTRYAAVRVIGRSLTPA